MFRSQKPVQNSPLWLNLAALSVHGQPCKCTLVAGESLMHWKKKCPGDWLAVREFWSRTLHCVSLSKDITIVVYSRVQKLNLTKSNNLKRVVAFQWPMGLQTIIQIQFVAITITFVIQNHTLCMCALKGHVHCGRYTECTLGVHTECSYTCIHCMYTRDTECRLYNECYTVV